MSATFPENLKEKKKKLFFYEFLCVPMSFKKINRKKKFVGKVRLYNRGIGIGPYVLLSE